MVLTGGHESSVALSVVEHETCHPTWWMIQHPSWRCGGREGGVDVWRRREGGREGGSGDEGT